VNHAVARRLAAEFTGTGLLVAVVGGSGIAATNLTSDAGLRLLINSLVTRSAWPC
jgi:glycerol uptake facilitator-like aquaporin